MTTQQFVVFGGNSVTYTATGAATPYSIGAVFQTVYNAKSYGAIGDGITDDTVNIQKTITAAAVLSGTVFLPAGTYLISNNLLLQSNVNIAGDSQETVTILCSQSSQYHVLFATSKTNISISGLTINGNANGSSPLGGASAVNLVSCSQITVNNVTAHDVFDSGVWGENCNNVLVTNSTFTNCGRSYSAENDGIAFVYLTSNITIADCLVNNGYHKGIALAGLGHSTSNFMVTGCTVTNCSTVAQDGGGIYISGSGGGQGPDIYSTNIVVTNNVCSGNYSNIVINITDGFSVSGNTTTDSSGSGSININSAQNGAVVANTCNRNGGIGIYVYGQASQCYGLNICGNLCNNNNTSAAAFGPGISLINVVNSIVRNNISTDDSMSPTQTQGVYEDYLNCSGNSIGDNICLNNTSVQNIYYPSNQIGMSISPGVNNNLPIGSFSFMRFAYQSQYSSSSIGSISGGIDHKMITLYQPDPTSKMILLSDSNPAASASTGFNLIKTPYGIDLSSNCVTLIFDAVISRWVVIGSATNSVGNDELSATLQDGSYTVDCALSSAGTYNASQFIIPSGTFTSNRQVTVNTDSAITGELIKFLKFDKTAHTLAIINGGGGGGTIITLPASIARACSIIYGGANWSLGNTWSLE